MPGSIMGLIRVNRPGYMIYGGSIKPGIISDNNLCGCDAIESDIQSGKYEIDIVNSFQAYGAYKAGKISNDEREYILQNAIPGPGGCGGMYTANTMATCIEAMGMSPLYSSSLLAESNDKLNE
eukprot:CAMPEP_0114667140 /NCGR_PEP_ID=MMETSP0191-20121206/33832_1 /TAXON_ID=126664 /ORGANISM="Sorites sp." /LENGTH=122 /DNA_ID=CAMNT_0001916629 /DNA_START=503 /DNA_END=871 /DNA_ORIENTATION=-